MHNFVYLAQRRSQEFFCEPNFGGKGVPPPLVAPVITYRNLRCWKLTQVDAACATAMTELNAKPKNRVLTLFSASRGGTVNDQGELDQGIAHFRAKFFPTWNKTPCWYRFLFTNKFKRIITSVDFSEYLHCLSDSSLYLSYSYGNSYGFTLSFLLYFCIPCTHYSSCIFCFLGAAARA